MFLCTRKEIFYTFFRGGPSPGTNRVLFFAALIEHTYSCLARQESALPVGLSQLEGKPISIRIRNIKQLMQTRVLFGVSGTHNIRVDGGPQSHIGGVF
jgi:hypothetical protein